MMVASRQSGSHSLGCSERGDPTFSNKLAERTHVGGVERHVCGSDDLHFVTPRLDPVPSMRASSLVPDALSMPTPGSSLKLTVPKPVLM